MIQEFISHLQAKNLNPLTVKCYQTDILQFEQFCISKGIAPVASTRETVQEYFDNPKFNPSTKRRKLATINGFFKWAVSQGHLNEKPPLRELALPPVEVHRVILSQDQQTKLYENIQGDDEFLTYRDRAIAKLCRYGMKLEQILNIQIVDMDKLLVSLHENKNHDGVDTDLVNYYKARTQRWTELHEPRLFLNCHGRPLSSRSIRRKLNYYGMRAGIGTVNPRVLRNTFKVVANTSFPQAPWYSSSSGRSFLR